MVNPHWWRIIVCVQHYSIHTALQLSLSSWFARNVGQWAISDTWLVARGAWSTIVYTKVLMNWLLKDLCYVMYDMSPPPRDLFWSILSPLLFVMTSLTLMHHESPPTWTRWIKPPVILSVYVFFFSLLWLPSVCTINGNISCLLVGAAGLRWPRETPRPDT